MSTTTAPSQALNDPKRNPLAPVTLAKAGVPSQDAVWITQLPLRDQMNALIASPRGKSVLEKLRAFMQSSGAPEPVMQ